jgi:5'(3')-deoxyribonucleotidase
MDKPIVFIDMDGVLADLGAGAKASPLFLEDQYKNDPDDIPDIFENLPPIKDAIEAVNKLHDTKRFDLFILTTAPWDNPSAWMHKRTWIEKHFGDRFYQKIIITHRKDLLIGDYLIDDRMARGAAEFKGKHIHFGWDYVNQKNNEFPNWKSVLEFFDCN